MQGAWLFCAMALIAQSDAEHEAAPPLRCVMCGGGGDSGACALDATAFAGHAVLCSQDQPYCATRASSPNFTSVLSCSAAITAGVCSLNYSVKGTYEMICVCSSQLCNAPFSHQMQTELINYTTFNSATNETQLNEMFWKLSHLANGSDADIYNKITEKIRGVTKTPPRREGSEWKTTRTSATNSVNPGGNSQRHVLPKEMRNADAYHQVEVPHHSVQKVEELRSQALRQVEAQVVLGERQAEGPRAQAVRQLPPTVAPSDDDEDEGEGSGADEESPGRRSPPAAPAAGAGAPDSYLPAAAASENGAVSVPLFFNLILISYLLLYTVV